MSDILMRTPLPYADESPRSYITRLSEANGYTTPQVVVDIAKGGSQFVITTGWDYSLLQTVIGSECRLPADFGYRFPGMEVRESVKVMGIAINSHHLGLKKARVCGQCLAEYGYVPTVWDLKAYLACPIHGCLMTKFCHACGKRVMYSRPGCSVCHCGSDIRSAPVVLAPPSLVGFCEILHTLVTGRDDTVLQAHHLGMPVDSLLGMDLNVYLRVAVVMANVLHSMEEIHVGNRPDAQVEEKLPEVGNAFCDWPNNFRALCRRWATHPTKKSISGNFQTHFSWLFSRLHKNLKERREQTAFMLKEAFVYRANADSLGVFRVKKAWIDSSQIPTTKNGSARDAAKLLNVNEAAITRWADSGKIRGVRFGRGEKKFWSIDLQALRDTRFSEFMGVTLRNASKVLGVSLKVTRRLRDGKIFPEDYVLRGDSRTVAYEDLVTFKTSLLDGCAEEPKGQETIALKDVFFRLEVEKQVGIIIAIANGAIPSYGKALKDISAIRIARCDAPTSLAKRGCGGKVGGVAVPSVKGGEFLTQSQVVSRYGLWRVEATAILLSLGCRQLKGRGIEPIEVKRLERFFSKHVLVRSIAKEFDLWVPQLLWELRKTCPGALLVLGGGIRKSKSCAALVLRSKLAVVRKIAGQLAEHIGQAQKLAKPSQYRPTPFQRFR